MDCGGFEKYQAVNLQNFLTYAPDYAMLVIAANKQLDEIEDQIRLAIALKSNFCIIVTHTDLVNEKALGNVMKIVLINRSEMLALNTMDLSRFL
jgi:GTPase